MSIWETLGEIIGKAFKSVTDSMLGLLKFKPEQLEAVNKEIAGESLDPEKFKTQEVKDLAKAIKDRLKTSPAGPADWVQGIMGDFMAKIWDVALSIMLPAKMDTFEEAKASATWLTSLFADFVVLSAVLDMVGTALSATLVRNLIHIFRLFAATFGMDRYLDACIAPALTTSIIPRLTRGYNKQYRTFLPPATDLITWVAKEVFEPTMRAKYGLDSEKEEIERELFYEQGLSDEQIDNYWAAHWEHASWMQVVEMLRRGQLTEDEVREWFRLVEIPPFWRDKLIAISYEVPTRVDVRRFWDMRTIDEARLREIYAWRGYHGKDLDDYVLWTKVYVAFPDLLARWKNGWITEDDVRSELIALGMPADRVEEMIQTKIKPTEPGRVSEELDLTKAEICAGVKKGVISWGEGLELLEDIGKSAEEAEFILAVKVGAAAGSPETYPEFKEWTQRFRKAAGMAAKPVPEELKKAAEEVVRLTGEVESLKEALKEEERGLIEEEPLPEAATEKRDELRVTLHRAEAELQRVKTEYDSLVAQWRHGE